MAAVADWSRRSAHPEVGGRCARTEKTSDARAQSTELIDGEPDQADPRGLLGFGEVELGSRRHVVEANCSIRTDRLLHQVPDERSVLGEGGEHAGQHREP